MCSGDFIMITRSKALFAGLEKNKVKSENHIESSNPLVDFHFAGVALRAAFTPASNALLLHFSLSNPVFQHSAHGIRLAVKVESEAL
jgi:hypothetical protein